jgi:hypothetical protein
MDTFNVPVTAILVFGAAAHFPKNGGALPKALCTQMAASLAFMP